MLLKDGLETQYYLFQPKRDIGHMDPANSPDFVYQSRKYQRPLKDRFKFDEHGLAKCPTIKELKTNFNEYYGTDAEAEELYLFLKSKLRE